MIPRLPRLHHRPLVRDAADLEREAGVERSVDPAPTLADVEKLERERLGPSWGRPRRKMSGWPRR